MPFREVENPSSDTRVQGTGWSIVLAVAETNQIGSGENGHGKKVVGENSVGV
jgi:hypothetical protein